MIRKAFVMTVNPDQHGEYERRHRPIWPELEATLKEHGVRNYSIFLLKETNQLFAYAEVEDEARWNSIAETDICKKWWAYMGDIMPANPDNSPVSVGLDEVFHIDRG
ncbi:MAG: L-rhamnose mutarotase [Kiritimatiellia bacterium]|jgi:L-rhamnose mutarotase|nr:L-rhamnose mutarotase [Kiritimatiellia bacterium]